VNTSNTSKKSSNFLVFNKDSEDSSKEENIATDGTGTTHSEHTIVEEEAEPNPSTDTDQDENEEEPDEADDDDDNDEDMDDDYEGFAFFQEDIMCSLQDKPGIPGSWISLYIQ